MATTGMKAYLAEKYMSGPKADAILSRVAPKKKKRKGNTTTAPTSASGANLLDEDGPTGWGDAGPAEDAEDLDEAVVEKDRGFKKRKTDQGSGWATIRDGVVDPETMNREPSPIPADEQPMVVAPTAFTGGLVPASDLHKVIPKTAPMRITQEEIEASKETVYRDAQGRKIDTKAARAEAARKKREKEEKEAAMMEWGKGLVQREEKEKMKLELEKQKGKSFSRYVDDADLNEELKTKELWNDPAAGFLTKKASKGPRKPQYAGPHPPPNRFGIKPGYRWDGVDRGNGFEKKLFQRSNDRKRKGLESYQWSVDDM